MRPVLLEFSNTREVQREELFLLTIVERILAGHMETISFVDLAQFCELMRKKPTDKINLAHAQILRIVERKLAKPINKAQEFQYVIKTVCTSPKSSVTKAFQSEFKKPKFNQQLSDSKHQEQQTIEMSDQNIQQQLGELIQKSQTQFDQDTTKVKDPRFHSMKNLDKQKFGASHQKPRKQIQQFDNIQIYDLKEEESTKQNTEQQQQLRQNTQITQNSQNTQQQQLPSTAHSKVVSRNNSKMNSKNNSRINSKQDIPYDSRQELKQELERLEAEEDQLEEINNNNNNNNNNNSNKLYNQSKNIQLNVPQDKQKEIIIKKSSLEQHKSNDLSNDFLSIQTNQQQQQYQQQIQQSQDETKSFTRTDDVILEKYENSQELPNHFINKIASAIENKGQGYINMDEVSIEQQNTLSQEEASMRNCKSDQEFRSNVHYYSSTQYNLQKGEKERDNPSQTSILEDQPIQINIQVNNCDNQQTIVEESQDGSPNQRTKIFIAYPKEQKNFETQGDNSLQTPQQYQQGSFNLNPVSPNLLKAEDQNWQSNSNRSKLQTPSSSSKIPISTNTVNRSRTTKSNFKKLDTQNSQLSINQLNQQDSLGLHNQQSIQLQNQKSEESQPESKMTIESSQGEKSNRSKNVKPAKSQLKIPGAAAAVQFAKRKNSAQPIDPKKLEQQEKERQKQLEYQKLIDRMKLERELMEQYKIPENMPLGQKKLIIESLINQLGEIKDQEAKYQIMLYNQRQEQISNAKQGNLMEFTTDVMSNCYADMEFLLENKLKIKSKEEQKVQFLKFSDQIHTHFPGQGKEFLKDEGSPLKRTYNKISDSDPVQIEASLKRKDGFIEESELLKLFQRFDSEYGKQVFQCDMDHPTIRDQNQNGYGGQNGLLPKLRKRKMTRVATSGRIELSTYRVDRNKIDLLRFKAQRISQVGRFLISSQ